MNNLKTGGTASIGELDEFLRWKMHIKFGGEGNTQELRARVPWLFRGVEIIADSTAAFPFEIRKGKTVVDESNHWENTLGFTKNIFDIIWRVSASLTMRGRSYLYPEFNRLGQVTGKPRALRYWVADTIEPHLDKEEGLKGFWRIVNGVRKPEFAVEQVVYFWLPDDNVEIGPPTIYPAQAALNAAGVLFNLDEFFIQHAKSGLVKAFIASAKGLPPGDAGRDERNRIQKMLSSMITGVRNIGKIIVAEAESLTIVPVGEGFAELQHTPITEEKRTDIAIALGIPASILWSSQTSGLGGRGVVNEDTNRLYRNKVVPHFNFIASVLNEQFFVPLGYKMVGRPEMLDAFKENEVNRSQAFVNYANALGPENRGFVLELLGVDLPEKYTYDQFNVKPVAPPTPTIDVTPKAKELVPGDTKPGNANEAPATGNLAPVKSYHTVQATQAQTGIMVAFAVPPLVGNKLLSAIQKKLPTGSDLSQLDQLHLTLAFLGKTDETTTSKSEVLTALKLFASRWGYQSGVIGGIGRMSKVESSGKSALYTMFDCPTLPAFRQDLVETLKAVGIVPSEEHGFIPHITLAYVAPDSDSIPIDFPSISNVSMTEIWLAWGGQWIEIPLSVATKSVRIDLDKWQRKALGSLKSTGSAACEFESDVILATVAEDIRGELQEAKDDDAVKTVFAKRMGAQPASMASVPFASDWTQSVKPNSVKSIDSVAAKFQALLTSLVTEAWSGDNYIKQDMRLIVQRYVEDAYFEGMLENGASPDALTDTDRTRIDALMANQDQYVAKFAQDVRDAKGDAQQQEQIRRRIDLWAQSIEQAGNEGTVAAARSRGEYRQWHTANDEISQDCEICAPLNNKVVKAGEPFGEDADGNPIYSEPGHKH